MSNVRFIGCLHFGHQWMAKKRGFIDSFAHDEHLIEEYNKVVSKRDIVYIVGDITMNAPEHYHQLDRLKGKKIVVLGNHDKADSVRELLNYVDSVAGMVDYKGFVITHCPIHPSDVGLCKGNIHAHIHHDNVLEEFKALNSYGDAHSTPQLTLHKYHNVDAHVINYKPKLLEDFIISNV